MSERECVHPLSPWGRIGARRCSARKGVLAAQMVVHGHTPASFHSTAKVQWVKKIQRQWLVRCDSTNLPYSKKIEKNSIFRRFFASRVVLSWIGNHCFYCFVPLFGSDSWKNRFERWSVVQTNSYKKVSGFFLVCAQQTSDLLWDKFECFWNVLRKVETTNQVYLQWISISGCSLGSKFVLQWPSSA